LGVQLALQDAGCMDISFMYGGEEETWRRRLVSLRAADAKAQIEQLIAEEVLTTWPHAGFFRPTALSCMPSSSKADQLWISGPYSAFQTVIPEISSKPLEMAPLPRTSVPAGTVAMCKPVQAVHAGTSDWSECLLGRLVEGGLAVWRHSEPSLSATILPFEGRPWTVMSGAILRCNALVGQARFARAGDDAWCLVLAGWDGQLIPVAVLPLGAGGGREPAIAPGTAVRPRFDVPVAEEPSSAAAGHELADVPTLHLDPSTGRLHALLRRRRHLGGGGGAEVQAWGLTGEQRSLGRWQLPASFSADASRSGSSSSSSSSTATSFQPAALCTTSSGGLLLAGVSGEQMVPQLFRLTSAGTLF